LRGILLRLAELMYQEGSGCTCCKSSYQAFAAVAPGLGLTHGAEHCYQTYYDYLFHFQLLVSHCMHTL
jgi:hypothetical protein